MTTNIYSDINSEFKKDIKTNDLVKDYDKDAIRNSVRNILMTKKMERRMMPQFGASLEQLLFEPIDNFTAKKIGSIIIEEITYWEPRISISNVTVQSNIDDMMYQIKLEYNIKTVSGINTDEIEFVLSQT